MTKKVKPLRPFRVKRSSIVCIRNSTANANFNANTSPPFLIANHSDVSNGNHGSNGNNGTSKKRKKRKHKHNSSSSSSSWQWLEPIPNKDDAPHALIGQKIRCILPKLSSSQAESQSQSQSQSSYSRILEGEVVSTSASARGEEDPDLDKDGNKYGDGNGDRQAQFQSQSHGRPFEFLTAKILVDQKVISSLPSCIKEKLQRGLDSNGDVEMNHMNNTNIETGGHGQPQQQQQEKLNAKALKKMAMEKRRRQLELKIQGEGKTIIQLLLPRPTHHVWKGNAKSTSASTNASDGKKNGNGMNQQTLETATAVTAVHWVIQKYVEVGHEDQNNEDEHGDGYDNDDMSSDGSLVSSSLLSQEEHNVRWIIRNHRYARHLLPMTKVSKFPLRFGEVMDILPTPGPVSVSASAPGVNNKKKTSSSPYAMVRIRPLGCLEDCITGRMSHHLENEFVDLTHVNGMNVIKGDGGACTRSVNGDNGDNGDNDNDHHCWVELPIEDLIVIGKRARRIYNHHDLKGYDWEGNHVEEEDVIIRYNYDIERRQFHPLELEVQREESGEIPTTTSNEISSNSSPGLKRQHQTCHRCKVVECEQKMKKCQSKYCGRNPDPAASTNTCTRIPKSGSKSKWWCGQCRKLFRKRGLLVFPKTKKKMMNGERDHGRDHDRGWLGPCCLGSCDCPDCVREAGYSFHNRLLSTRTTAAPSSSLQHQNVAVDGGMTTGRDREEIIRCIQCSRICCDDSSHYKCSICFRSYHQGCYKWWTTLEQEKIGGDKKQGGKMPLSPTCWKEGMKEFQCHSCQKSQNIHDGKNDDRINIHMDNNNRDSSQQSLLQMMADSLDSLPPSDFSLPFNFLQPPVSKKKTVRSPPRDTRRSRSSKRPRKEGQNVTRGSARKQQSEVVAELSSEPKQIVRNDDDDRNKNIVSSCCSRIVPHDASKFTTRSVNNSAAHAATSLASMRSGGRKVVARSIRGKKEDSDKKSSSRAARANQRRMLKDAASFGIVKDNMSGCEHALRFGKSIIHGWGVFSDEHIGAGDLILEYRGVLIGNAVADKREREYELAKIGSDYMFRIDSSKVCDATHHGNLARFINASCSPNCYTQIITVNGAKRIAIYAKKDIKPGEELSYDYKFEPEYNVSERIPCNCGMPDCRGFLNWDKRYVAIEPPKT